MSAACMAAISLGATKVVLACVDVLAPAPMMLDLRDVYDKLLLAQAGASKVTRKLLIPGFRD